MGIHFACHGCGKPLNIKNDLAGRRGVCPECNTRFRIPMSDTEYSSPIEVRAKVPNSQAPISAKLAEGASGAERDTQPSASVAEATNPQVAPQQHDSSSATQTAASHPATSQPATSELLDDESITTWYVRPPSGGQYGPATGDVLKNWIGEGRVAKQALLWREGWPQWREAGEALPEIADQLPGSPIDESVGFGGDPARQTTSFAGQKTSPIQSSPNGQLSGQSSIGSVRRKRTHQRFTMVAVLGTIVIGLIIVLVVVANRS